MLEEHDRVTFPVLDDLDLFRTQILDRPPFGVGHLDVETRQLDTGPELGCVLLAREPGRPGGDKQHDDSCTMAFHRVPSPRPRYNPHSV